jgi:hypothetical protein
VKPNLAALVKAAPDGPSWLHEIKLDGYRMHARLDAGRVKILTRRGNDWTEKYPSIAEALTSLPADTAYLDGELCGLLPDGRTAFNLIQNAMEHGVAAREDAAGRPGQLIRDRRDVMFGDPRVERHDHQARARLRGNRLSATRRRPFQVPGNSIGYGVDYGPDAPDIPAVLVDCEPEVHHRCRCGCLVDPGQTGNLVAVKARQVAHAVTREK